MSSAEANLRRLRDDYAFWALSCITVLDKLGRYVPLRLNPVQQAIEAVEAAILGETGSVRLYVLKARQPGVSTHEQCKNLHLIWKQRGATALTLVDNDKNLDKVFVVTQRAVERFPRELLPQMGGRETREIGFVRRDSHFWTDTAGSKTAGRAITLWRLHGSEFAYWDQPRDTLSAATPSLVPHGSVVTLETTGGGFDSEAHNFWRETRGGKTGYIGLFFPWWECDPVHYAIPLLAPDELGPLEPDEQRLAEQHHLTVEQIKWRRKMIREMGSATFLQEYAEDEATCWLASGAPYFEFSTIKALMGEPAQPIATERNGELEIFGTLAEGDAAIIGVDPAEGVGGDRSAFEARAFPSWRLLATFASRTIPPEEFAALIDAWGRKLRMAFLVVERNTITTLRRLLDHHGYPYDRIYHRQRFGNAAAEATPQVGWLTSKETVPLMGDAGRELLNAAFDRAIPPANDRGAGTVTLQCLRDAAAIQRNERGVPEFTGKDALVASLLCWLGRGAYPMGRDALPVSLEQAAEFRMGEPARFSTDGEGVIAPESLVLGEGRWVE